MTNGDWINLVIALTAAIGVMNGGLVFAIRSIVRAMLAEHETKDAERHTENVGRLSALETEIKLMRRAR